MVVQARILTAALDQILHCDYGNMRYRVEIFWRGREQVAYSNTSSNESKD